MRYHWLLAVTLLCALVLGACGGTTTDPGGQPATPAVGSATTVTPQANRVAAPTDTLRWSIEGVSDLPTIDPARSSTAEQVTVNNLLYAGLVRLDDTLEIVGDGAENWEVGADGRTYTFTIREGLRFADGTPVTSADFAYALNRALSPATGSFGAPSQLGLIVGAQAVVSGTAELAAGITTPDDRTLQLKLERPQAHFLLQLTYPYAFVVPRKLIESGDDWEQRAYGTGPYRVKEWRRGQSILLEANPNYWQGAPGIPQVLLPFNQDSETAYQLYQTGELDIMGNPQTPVPSAHVSELEGKPDFRSLVSLTTSFVGFNNRRAPFDNVEVRRAFALAVDREELARQVLANTVISATRILPPRMIGTQIPIRPLDFDPAAAQQALAAAGFPAGQGLPQVTLSYGSSGENDLVAQALQSFWRQNLGVEVTLQALEKSTFIDALDLTTVQPEEGLQLYLSIWGADYPDPHNFLSLQLTSSSKYNNGHFSDSQFDSWVGEADQLTDLDQRQRRLQLYNQAEQRAISDVGWLPLYHPRFNVLINPRVQGFEISPIGFVINDWSKVALQ